MQLNCDYHDLTNLRGKLEEFDFYVNFLIGIWTEILREQGNFFSLFSKAWGNSVEITKRANSDILTNNRSVSVLSQQGSDSVCVWRSADCDIIIN